MTRAPSQATPGAINGDADAAASFNGTGTGLVKTNSTVATTPAFSIEAWVKTTSTQGGKIVGYGASATGESGSYDRHVYMDNAGRVFFGVYPNAVRTVNSAPGFNDGQWHHIVATQGSGGIALYVDGRRVGQDPSVTGAQVYNGYWRIGGDNLNGWPNRPTSLYLNGQIDDVAIYPTALPLSKVDAHFVASGRTSPIPPRPADDYGRAVYDDEPVTYFRFNEANGPAAIDASTSGINGSFTNTGVTYGQTGAIADVTNNAVRVAERRPGLARPTRRATRRPTRPRSGSAATRPRAARSSGSATPPPAPAATTTATSTCATTAA